MIIFLSQRSYLACPFLSSRALIELNQRLPALSQSNPSFSLVSKQGQTATGRLYIMALIPSSFGGETALRGKSQSGHQFGIYNDDLLMGQSRRTLLWASASQVSQAACIQDVTSEQYT